VTVLPITSELRVAPLLRIPIEPTPDNGLRKKSQLMIDKILTVPRDKIGSTVGTLHEDTLVEVNRSLATFLGIG
jgi:mRNA interferase MazF